MPKQNKEFEQCSNTVILLENVLATSAPPNEDDDQPGSPTVLLEVSLGKNVYDLTRDNPDDDDDVISALRELD